MRSLKGSPGGVNDERTQPEKDQKRLPPPDVGPHGLAERTSWKFSSSVRHGLRTMTRAVTFKQTGTQFIGSGFQIRAGTWASGPVRPAGILSAITSYLTAE